MGMVTNTREFTQLVYYYLNIDICLSVHYILKLNTVFDMVDIYVMVVIEIFYNVV